MSEFTTNMNFELVNFNQITWHDEEHNNWIIADAAFRALGMTGLLGIWQNSTAYVLNDRVVDPELFAIYQCAVAHTSGAAPTLFAADRVAHPTFWTLISTFPVVDYLPTVDDTTSLGALTHRFANLFLKSTGTVNFGNSNYIITHAPGQLTLGGIVIATGNLSTNGTFSAAGLATLSAGLVVGGGAFTSTGGAITLSPANFNVVISPTGTGVVTIAPATVGSMNNMNIGNVTRGSLAATTGNFNSTLDVTSTFTLTGVANLGNAVNTSGLITLTTGQIKFPATQTPSADANTFDDYEEGTFTPGVAFAGVSTGITYTTQTGSYTKLGRAVAWRSTVVLSNKGAAAGAAQMTGLPFTTDALTYPAVVNCGSAVFATLGAGLTGLIGASSTVLAFTTSTTTGNTVSNNTNWTNTSSFDAGGVYFTT